MTISRQTRCVYQVKYTRIKYEPVKIINGIKMCYIRVNDMISKLSTFPLEDAPDALTDQTP